VLDEPERAALFEAMRKVRADAGDFRCEN